MNHASGDRHDTEADTQRRGTRYYRAGMGIGLGTHIIILTIAVLFPDVRRSHLLLMFMFALAGIVTSGIYITLGKVEALNRPQRAAVLQILTRYTADRARLDGMISAVNERLDAFNTDLQAMGETVKRVPDYGAGVIDGVQMRQAAVNNAETD